MMNVVEERRTRANSVKKTWNERKARAKALRRNRYSNNEIAELMDLHESTIRSMLNESDDLEDLTYVQ